MITRCNISDAIDLSEQQAPYVLTTAGNDPKEDNDCGVVALALAADIDYASAHELLRLCVGRQNKAPTLSMWSACRFLPLKIRQMNKKRFRLSTLPNRYPKGRYYVQIGGRDIKSRFGIDGKHHCHAMALIDGKIYDRHINPPSRWVTGVWRIEGLKADSWWGWKAKELPARFRP